MALDILIFMIIALFLGIKLWSVLGKQPPTVQGQRTTIHLHENDVVIEKEQETKGPFYPGFLESYFLEGAEKAFHSILMAYYQEDEASLRNLMTPEMLPYFKKPKKESPKINLLSSNIAEKELKGNLAFIKVHFVSLQETSHQKEELDDFWTFQRDITDSNPNWKLCALSEAK